MSLGPAKLFTVYISSPLPNVASHHPNVKRRGRVQRQKIRPSQALSNRSRTSKTSKRNSATAPTAGTPEMAALKKNRLNHGVIRKQCSSETEGRMVNEWSMFFSCGGTSGRKAATCPSTASLLRFDFCFFAVGREKLEIQPSFLGWGMKEKMPEAQRLAAERKGWVGCSKLHGFPMSEVKAILQELLGDWVGSPA